MSVIFQLSCLTVLLLGIVRTSVLPVEKCTLTDSKCMTAAYQKAIPHFMAGLPNVGVEVLDPLHLDDIYFDISGLKFSLKGGVLRGLKSAEINAVNWDLDKKRISVDYHMNGVTKGHYTANGKIFILPIKGDGMIKITFNKLFISMHLDYKLQKGAGGQDHVIPTKYDYNFDVENYAHFNMTNLFGGEKTLSSGMHQFLNDNWKAVSVEFGKPLLNAAANTIFKSVVNFFKNVPISDIARV